MEFLFFAATIIGVAVVVGLTSYRLGYAKGRLDAFDYALRLVRHKGSPMRSIHDEVFE